MKVRAHADKAGVVVIDAERGKHLSAGAVADLRGHNTVEQVIHLGLVAVGNHDLVAEVC